MPCTWDDLRPFADWLRQQPGGIHKNILSVQAWFGEPPMWNGVIGTYTPAWWINVPVPARISPGHNVLPRIEGQFEGAIFAGGERAPLYITVLNDDPAIQATVAFPSGTVNISPLDCELIAQTGGLFLNGLVGEESTYNIHVQKSTTVASPAGYVAPGVFG